jgi:hypothetical protein
MIYLKYIIIYYLLTLLISININANNVEKEVKSNSIKANIRFVSYNASPYKVSPLITLGVSYSKYINNIEISPSLDFIALASNVGDNHRPGILFKNNIMYNFIINKDFYIATGGAIGYALIDVKSLINSSNIEFGYKNFIVEYEYMYFWNKANLFAVSNGDRVDFKGNLQSQSILLKYRWIF